MFHEAESENMQCKHAMQNCKARLSKDTAVQLYCIYMADGE